MISPSLGRVGSCLRCGVAVLLLACGQGSEDSAGARPAPPVLFEALRAAGSGAEAIPGSGNLAAGDFDILLLVLDACRADRVGAYGYERPTTPQLDALARDPDAVLFENYYVEGNWTKPSTASLFTGSYIHQHGLREGHLPASDSQPGATGWVTQGLADEHLTLAEALRERGFATFGVVKSRHLVSKYGFAQGFQVYLGPDEARGDARRVREVLKLIERQARPYFGYVHLNACHHPFQERERDAAFMQAFAIGYDEERRARAGIDFRKAEIKHRIDRGELELDAQDQRYLSLLYDAQLRRVDETLVRPLLEGLETRGRWDRTLLMVTADHGEELFEHRGYAHGHALWDEVIRVPLIVKFPAGGRPEGLDRRVSAAVGNVDLMPSILGLLGEEAQLALPGRQILQPEPAPGDALSGGVAAAGFAYSQQGEDWVVIEGRWKLHRRGDATLLFDRALDPGEREDRASDSPAIVSRLRALGEGVRSRTTPGESATRIETQLSDDALNSLRELGYID